MDGYKKERESGPVIPLEQRCVRPGLWRIEGWDVERYHWQGHGWRWRIKGSTDVPAPGVQRRTLAEIREWIRERREEG